MVLPLIVAAGGAAGVPLAGCGLAIWLGGWVAAQSAANTALHGPGPTAITPRCELCGYTAGLLSCVTWHRVTWRARGWGGLAPPTPAGRGVLQLAPLIASLLTSGATGGVGSAVGRWALCTHVRPWQPPHPQGTQLAQGLWAVDSSQPWPPRR
jgi:hypothetical protein